MRKETLEEAAEKLYPAEWDWKEKESFIEGAQWQQERMYSEQDMEDSFIACWKANVSEGIECKLSFKEWFDEFKKL